MKLIILALLLLCVLSRMPWTSEEDQIKKRIKELDEAIQKHYWKKDQKLVFPILWERRKGLYASSIRANYVDRKNRQFAQTMRSKVLIIDDINMFVTSFVLLGQLEASELGTIAINDHMFSESLMALNEFRDKNSPPGIPKYIFWPQKLVNGTWSAFPINLVHVIQKFFPRPFPPKIEDYLADHGAFFLVIGYYAKYELVIPPDNDDSSVNLALLSFLNETNSSHYQFMNSFNYKKQEYYDVALKYAYRPFDQDTPYNEEANEIDPRTYYMIHGLLEEVYEEAKAKNQKPSFILPTTWLINKKQSTFRIQKMPLSVNNVDATVCANFLFGICCQILQKQIKLNDELIQMMLDTTRLLQYTVKKLIQVRPDLILVYYPSKYDFYWFVSRVVSLLKRKQSQLVYPLPQIFDRLQSLMKNEGKNHLLSKAIKKKNMIHWHEFIGNYAGKDRDDDAVFSTAVVLNSLIDTWTVRDKRKITYDEDTPAQIKDTIKKTATYILEQLGKKHLEMNAFFSGSLKVIDTTDPFRYPANLHKSNGTNFDPQKVKQKDVDPFTVQYSMKGYVSKETYSDYLKLNWFQYYVPEKFVDYNARRGIVFPFWSSSAITEINCLTSLSKYLRLIQNQ